MYKKQTCFTLSILLILLIQGSIESQLDMDTRECGSFEKGELVSDQEREEIECPASPVNVIPSYESAYVQDDHDLYVYVRNLGDSIPISYQFFDCYLNYTCLGNVAAVYERDCKTLPDKWNQGAVLCILITHQEEFRKGDVVKIVMCNGVTIAFLILEAGMFKNSEKVEEQKIAEAEGALRNGILYLEKEEYENAIKEFTQAKNTYEQINNEGGIASAEEYIKIGETLNAAKNAFEEVKNSLGKADYILVQYSAEEYLAEAEDHLTSIKYRLTEVKKSYEKIGKKEVLKVTERVLRGIEEVLKEIEQYFFQIEEIREAVELFDRGKHQIEEGQIEKGLDNLKSARATLEKYGWSAHVQEIEKAESEPRNWVGILEAVAAFIGIITFIVGIFRHFHRIGIERLKKKKNIIFKQNKQKFKEENYKNSESSFEIVKKEYDKFNELFGSPEELEELFQKM